MMFKRVHVALMACIGACFVLAAAAQTPPSAAVLSDGEVRKVDQDNRKLTIKHGPLANLDMPGMTMVFQVRDELPMDQLQPGDKVRFAAEKIDGKFTVTRIERQAAN